MSNSSDYALMVESMISIFTADKGTLKVLLMRKKTDPYKGYWILPGNMVGKDETVEDNIVDVVYDKIGLISLYIEQTHIFSDVSRNPDNRVLAVAYMGLVDNVTLLLKREVREDVETEWFDINDLPKLGFDHDIILSKTIDYLSKKIGNIGVLKSLFPSDFTLPEIQKIYESVLNVKIDRRNFRKKFINLGLIEETGENFEGVNGRPAKLYRFKDNIKELNII